MRQGEVDALMGHCRRIDQGVTSSFLSVNRRLPANAPVRLDGHRGSQGV